MGVDCFDDGTAAAPADGGSWTVPMVRARIAEAMDTLRRLKFPDNGAPGRLRSAMPLPPADWSAYGWHDEWPQKSAPSPKAIRRLDETLPWLLWVEAPRHRKAVCLRAVGLSWRRVARAVGVSSPETVRNWEAAAIEAIAAQLNAAQLGASAGSINRLSDRRR